METLIIDEISMIGCLKLLKVDALLKKVFNDTRPFGGLNVLLSGDFAQLPAVKQTPIINVMVSSTKMHLDPSNLEMKVEALFGLFTKIVTIYIKMEIIYCLLIHFMTWNVTNSNHLLQ